ncbi:MAG: TrkH family potassium uptake protein [Planctomycetota bacterium]
MRLGVVVAIIARLVRLFALAMLPPFVLALVDGSTRTVLAFGGAGLVCALFGSFFGRLAQAPRLLQRNEAMAVVAGTWLALATFGGLPYVLVEHGLTPMDALFEAMSGFTTTGATVLTDFSHYDRSFFLWRAMTQWFGGLGVIALGVVVLPRLGIAGRQLMFAEASGAPSEGISPQVREAARWLWILYTGLSALLIVLLMGQGLSLYDGVVHSMTTMSAGGFSPYGRSIEGIANPGVEWVLVVFMVIAGSSYALQWRAFARGPQELFRDGEFVAYVLLSALLAGGLAWVLAGGTPGEPELRAAAFQVASLASSTGYASVDYEVWTPAAKALLILAMLLGGCAGSACGGPKVVRWLILGKFFRREVLQALHPRAVLALTWKGRTVTPPILRSVLMLIFAFLALYLFVGVFLVVAEGVSLEEGFSSSIACVGNIGPGFGRFGPMGSFAGYSPLAKAVLVVAMWLGRLEVMTVLALVGREAWRGVHWRDAPRAESTR